MAENSLICNHLPEVMGKTASLSGYGGRIGAALLPALDNHSTSESIL